MMLGWGRGAGSGSTGRSADSNAIFLQLEGFFGVMMQQCGAKAIAGAINTSEDELLQF